MALVRAAGGILWRTGERGPEVALVHRPRRDDWSLPKGKLAEGEEWRAAALREVREETGCEARLASFAGVSFYESRRGPKLVLYWNMSLVRERSLERGGEVDEVAWLSPPEALRRLDRARERRILQRAWSELRSVITRGPGRTATLARPSAA